MKSFLLLASTAALAAAALASPFVVHEGRSTDAPGWSLQRRADPSVIIPLKISLVQSNLDNLDAYLLDVADPASANYGKHWTHEKVVETFRPSQESTNTVYSWLAGDHSIDTARIRLGKDGGALHLEVTIAEAEGILDAEYYVFRNADGTERIKAYQPYRIPEHVSKHVDFIWPTRHIDDDPSMRRRRDVRSRLGARTSESDIKALNITHGGADRCDQEVTLECLRQLYNFNYTLVSKDKNTVAVVEYTPEVYLGSDLDKFFQMFSPDQVGRRPKLIGIEGGRLNDSADPGNLGESNMDFQLVMGLLPGQDVFLYEVQSGEDQPNPDLNLNDDRLLAAFDKSYCTKDGVKEQKLTDCGNKPLANVFSISYGSNQDINDKGGEISAVIARQCAEYGKLSLQGATFLVSSGDEGVAGGSASGGDLECIVNGTLKHHATSGSFAPEFPASCPYVTSVGATQVSLGKTVRDPEVATDQFYSGGGFSNVFPRPDWQDAQVMGYLGKYAPPYAPDVFNRSGRGFPDVAANGWNTVVVSNGTLQKSGGTSASAPIVAALIAAVNDARIAKGKGPVGWINPALYSAKFKGVFNEITNGSNPGCGTNGFPAAPGWNPVTGLGTLNFPLVLEQFLALP